MAKRGRRMFTVDEKKTGPVLTYSSGCCHVLPLEQRPVSCVPSWRSSPVEGIERRRGASQSESSHEGVHSPSHTLAPYRGSLGSQLASCVPKRQIDCFPVYL